MESEYLIKGSKPGFAEVFLDNKKIAIIKNAENANFKLVKTDAHEWLITRKVHGEILPFSISIIDQNKGDKEFVDQQVFTVREHLFKNNNNFYMFTNHPEGRHWNEYLSGPRHISRLDNFPYTDLKQMDHHIKHKLKRYRGVSVGEASGLGIREHRVKIQKDLSEIGLFVAVSSYLLYSMG